MRCSREHFQSELIVRVGRSIVLTPFCAPSSRLGLPEPEYVAIGQRAQQCFETRRAARADPVHHRQPLMELAVECGGERSRHPRQRRLPQRAR
jgi:hypothetical protein